MNTNLISKAINDAIVKCGGVYYNLEKSLKLITDNNEEYTILKKDISNFYKNYRNKNKEYLITMDNKKNTLLVGGTDESRVDWDDNVIKEGETNGILYSIHNHPNSTTLPSRADFNRLCQTNCKYSITVSSDGVLIIKNNNPITEFNRDNVLENKLYADTGMAYNSFFFNLLNKFEENNLTDLDKIKEKYNYHNIELFDNDPKLQEEYYQAKDDLLTKYIKKNMDTTLNDLQDDLNYRECKLYAFHIPNKTIK